ncbi:MAG: fasciclin domain-containing protein [Gemmatimonadota bacterium]|nr:fasciclin domain-containing protein [Gemmatimonadota bacterium]
MTNRIFHAAAAVATLLTLSACASTYPSMETKPMKNIVQVAVENGNFNTLVAAVKAAGLAETLQGPGPFTVFAPTDAAFAKLPAGTINALLADKEKLASILTYHVVSGKVVASDITRMNGANPVTVNGQKLDIAVRGGKVYVNGAQIVAADVQASNGVIHVIDGVLMPMAAPAMSAR